MLPEKLCDGTKSLRWVTAAGNTPLFKGRDTTTEPSILTVAFPLVDCCDWANEPDMWTDPVFSNFPTLIKVLEPETVKEPVITKRKYLEKYLLLF